MEFIMNMMGNVAWNNIKNVQICNHLTSLLYFIVECWVHHILSSTSKQGLVGKMVSLFKVWCQLICARAWTLYGAPINPPLTACTWTLSWCRMCIVGSCIILGWYMLRLKAIQVKPGHGTRPGRNLQSLYNAYSPKLSLFCERMTLTFHIEVIIYNKWASGPWIVADLGNFSK